MGNACNIKLHGKIGNNSTGHGNISICKYHQKVYAPQKVCFLRPAIHKAALGVGKFLNDHAERLLIMRKVCKVLTILVMLIPPSESS